MPELGKATYWLTLNSQEFLGKLDATEGAATAATNGIATGFNRADKAILTMGSTTRKVAGTVVTASEEMGAAAEGAAAASQGAAVKTETAWARASAAIKKHGKIGGQAGTLLGLGAAYLVIKGGIEWLKDSNAATLQLNSALRATGGIAGVTGKHANELADKYEKLTGAEKGATLGTEAMLLGFKNIRNVGTGTNAIFDRTLLAVENVSARTGRSITAVAVQIGKAVQDPTKYLGLLGRAGITFTKVQQDMVKHIAATKGTLAAQKYLLAQLDARYRGAAEAAGKSFAGQLRRARAEIDQSSARIVTSFIPAFVGVVRVLRNVAGLLSHHARLVKNVVLAYLALRAALFVARTALILYTGTLRIINALTWVYTGRVGMLGKAKVLTATETGGLTAATAGEAAATDVAAASTVGLTGALEAARVAMATALPVLAAAAAAYWVLQKAASAAQKAIDAEDAASKHLASTHVLEEVVYTRRFQTNRKKGMSLAASRKDAARVVNMWLKNQGLPANFKLGKGGSVAGQFDNVSPETADGKGAKAPPRVIAPPKKAPRSISDLAALPIAIQTEEAKAQASGSDAQLRKVFAEEDKYYRGLLVKYKDRPKVVLALWQGIASVDGQIQSIDDAAAAAKKKAAKKKKAKLKHVLLMTPKIEIAIAKAERTAGLLDDIKQWTVEKNYLLGLLKNKKLQESERARIETQLTATEKRIEALRKKRLKALKDARNARMAEINEALSLRASFFGQFASNIFHNTKGGLANGAAPVKHPDQGGGDLHYNQNNTFHEIPADRFKLARQARLAVGASFGGI